LKPAKKPARQRKCSECDHLRRQLSAADGWFMATMAEIDNQQDCVDAMISALCRSLEIANNRYEGASILLRGSRLLQADMVKKLRDLMLRCYPDLEGRRWIPSNRIEEILQ
jgi:hypothetical protein